MKHFRPLVRDLVGSLLYRIGLARPGGAWVNRLHIVTFHRVLPPDQVPDLAVTEDEFRWLVGFFAENFTIYPLAEVTRRWSSGERPAKPLLAITFDDGQRDNYVYARPILEAAGVRGSFYVPVQAIMNGEPIWHDRLGYAVAHLNIINPAEADSISATLGISNDLCRRTMVPKLVERTKTLEPLEREHFLNAVEEAAGGSFRPIWDGMMTWEQLRQLIAEGHEVGSHSMTHPLLDMLDDASLDYEISGSRRLLEQNTDTPITTFCYPNGNFNERVKEAVRRAGYTCAVCTRWGPNSPGADLFELTRCDIQSETSRSRKGLLSESRVALRMSPLNLR
jgi:peptidoglycan/xylan/chitin deacetylase (PgdA/CDA1 family)